MNKINKISLFVIGAIIIVIGTGVYYLSNSSDKDKLNLNNKESDIVINTEPLIVVTPIEQTKPIIKNTNDIKKIMTATLHTNKGEFTISFSETTPKTVANFIKLAKEGFYDGTKFHRIIKGFMNQGGDPLTKDDGMMSRWGTGDPGYKFEDEIGPNNRNDRGTIAMANSGPNTNGSQFFINAGDNNFLDTKHTVFGKVTSGLDVVMAINAIPTDQSDRPATPVILEKITLK